MNKTNPCESDNVWMYNVFENTTQLSGHAYVLRYGSLLGCILVSISEQFPSSLNGVLQP